MAQAMATGDSSSGSDKLGLGCGSEWLGMLVTAAQVAQGCGCKGSLKAGEGKMKYVKSQNPHPSFYKSSRAAEGSFPSNFAIIANLSLACITRKSNFQY